MVPDPLAELARLEGVPSAVAAAVAAVDVVLRDRGPRAVTRESQAAALAASATASAELTEDHDIWLAGSFRLSAELAALAGVIQVAPAQALARAHAVVARRVLADDDLGRVVDDRAVSMRVRGLADLLTTPTRASGVVLAAIVHAEIATLTPFIDTAPFAGANGLVARAAEHLVLMSTGLDPRGVIVVEAGHRASGPAYGAALRGYAESGLSGVKEWILHCVQAVTYGAEVSPLHHSRR